MKVTKPIIRADSGSMRSATSTTSGFIPNQPGFCPRGSQVQSLATIASSPWVWPHQSQMERNAVTHASPDASGPTQVWTALKGMS